MANLTSMGAAQLLMEELETIGVKTVFTTIRRNNLFSEALIVEGNTKTNLQATVYIDELVKEILAAKNTEVKSLVKEKARQIAVHLRTNKLPENFSFDVELLKNMGNVKKRIFARLTNCKWNDLTDIPHIPFTTDLAVVFSLWLDGLLPVQEGITSETAIKQDLCDEWGVSAEILMAIARENANDIVIPIEQILGQSRLAEQDTVPHMFIATDRNRKSAAVIATTDVLKNFAMEWDSDIIILPSSTMEVILVPISEDMDIKDMDSFSDIVNAVNKSVIKREQLSDHAYCYRRKTDSIEG